MKKRKPGYVKVMAALLIAILSAGSYSMGAAAAESASEAVSAAQAQTEETETETESETQSEETEATEAEAEAAAEEAAAAQIEQEAAEAASQKAVESTVDSSLQKAAGETTATETSASETEAANGWNAAHTQYLKNGAAVQGLQVIDGATYYFNSSGILQTGWQKINGKTYYFETSTGKMLTGFQKIGKYYYCFGSDGAMRTGLRKGKLNGKSVYAYFSAKKKGRMQTGYIRVNSKHYYYAKSNGKVIYNLKKKYGFWRVYNMKKKQLKDLRKTVLNSKKYRIRINCRTNVVTIVCKFRDKKYSLPIKAWRCSTGKNMANATPKGTYTIHAKYRWLLMLGGVYCQWLTYIGRNCLIHSEIYTSRNNHSLRTSAYNKLGHGASHGCVRMPAEGAKWIYDYCKSGTKMYIFSGSSKNDPLGKPALHKLKSWHRWDPTDPTAQKYCKKHHCHAYAK